MQAIHPSLCPILYVQDNEQPTPETTRTTTDVKTRNTIIEVKTSSGPYEMGKAMLEIVVQTRVSDSQYILPKLEKGKENGDVDVKSKAIESALGNKEDSANLNPLIPPFHKLIEALLEYEAARNEAGQNSATFNQYSVVSLALSMSSPLSADLYHATILLST
ncbi:hypothetical protein H4Q26_015738 [Puccinia striiformis f. sp. tritici PST-130]|nr:hypothetical protein H4Q26_015738 [Puccinia striiformis f. sp. tritici PST-130]